MVIVVDGRTDEEKLLELLATGAEETALDFKATLNLSGRATKDSVEFAKDAISMGNLPSGGYIVVGVDDTGAAAHDQAVVAVDQFDSANLRAKVAKYVEAPTHIVSQHHVVDGRAVVLIYIAPNPDGLPVPISSIGQYVKDNGRSDTVFSVCEVLIREGTSNVRLRYAHWNQLLAQYPVSGSRLTHAATRTSWFVVSWRASGEASLAAGPASRWTPGWTTRPWSKRSSRCSSPVHRSGCSGF